MKYLKNMLRTSGQVPLHYIIPRVLLLPAANPQFANLAEALVHAECPLNSLVFTKDNPKVLALSSRWWLISKNGIGLIVQSTLKMEGLQ